MSSWARSSTILPSARSGEVHDDVRADELLRQRGVAGGEELAGEALHDALVRLGGHLSRVGFRGGGGTGVAVGRAGRGVTTRSAGREGESCQRREYDR